MTIISSESQDGEPSIASIRWINVVPMVFFAISKNWLVVTGT
jgi:hypothetical protein